MVLNATEKQLVALLQEGLPLVSRPFAELAARAGIPEAALREHVTRWIDDGTIKRFGVVVRHHELGYTANAMVVWDISDDRVDEIGRRLAGFDCVSLCYRRPRRLPAWPYNLFCMIHGRNRAGVLVRVSELARAVGIENARHRALFSRRRFKQRGARYVFHRTSGDSAHG